jgi:hypothetical protein
MSQKSATADRQQKSSSSSSFLLRKDERAEVDLLMMMMMTFGLEGRKEEEQRMEVGRLMNEWSVRGVEIFNEMLVWPKSTPSSPHHLSIVPYKLSFTLSLSYWVGAGMMMMMIR